VTAALRTGAGALLGLLLSVNAVSAQGLTGPGKTPKSPDGGVLVAPPEFEADSSWTTWGEDEVVARLVYAPTKALGAWGFQKGTRFELEGLLQDTEIHARSIVGSLSTRAMSVPAARHAMSEVLLGYHAALRELLVTR
jgi:hypothetical protein